MRHDDFEGQAQGLVGSEHSPGLCVACSSASTILTVGFLTDASLNRSAPVDELITEDAPWLAVALAMLVQV